MVDKYNINAVLGDELEMILRTKGLLDAVKAGETSCFICGKILTLENIGAIHIIDGKTKLCCDDEDCINP